MKKLLIAVLSAIAVFGAVLGFSACGNETKLPTTAYEKVVFAFNGVEKSFTSAAKKSSYKTASAEGLSSPDFESALNIIRGVYTSGDNQGDVIDELEYDQPPMIQFQCLKKVMEKTGANFSLGTKYYYDVHGEMYMDAETGFQVENTAADAQDHKYSYVFDFALAVDIDENDLITAEVSFNIHLERTDESYDTVWFVRLELDYDMTDATPNYSLAMFTENDETDLPFYNADTYEYDFVNVKDNVINEWRKFCYSTDRKVVKDETHTAFSDYIAEGITYKADTCKWYENKALRKITQQTAEKQQTIAGAFFGGIGLNSTDINAKPFLDRQGTKTEIIKNLYSEMSSIFRKDLVYNLVCKDEEGVHGDNGGNGNGNSEQPSSFIGVFIDGEFQSEVKLVNDMTGERFLKSVDFYYVSETQGTLNQVTDFSSAKFNFYSFNDLDMPYVSLDYRGFITSGMLNILEQVDNNGKMEIVLGNAVSIFHIYYDNGQGGNQGDGQNDDDGSAAILAEMQNKGFLPYDTQKGQITATKENGGNYAVTVSGTTEDEIAAYKTKLANNDYIQTEYETYCAKVTGGNFLYVDFNKSSSGEIRFGVRLEENTRFTEWPTENITGWLNGFDEFPQPTDSSVLYETGLYGPIGVAVYGLSDTACQTFFADLSSIGSVTNNGENQLFFTYEYNGSLYTVEINKNEYNLYVDFDSERHGGPQQLYAFSVQKNSDTPANMQWAITDGRTVYSVTLNLTENDTVTFRETVGNLSHVELSNENFENTENKTVFTVKSSGTYTFIVEIYDGSNAMIRVTKA